MNWIGYIAVYIIVWMVCLFVVLPFGTHTQAEAGAVVAGSEPGAPAEFRIFKKLLITSVLALAACGVIYVLVTNPSLQRYWR